MKRALLPGRRSSSAWTSLCGPLLLLTAAVVFGETPLAPARAAAAESWIFNRSYYSHDPVRPVRVGRATAGGPVFSRPQGAYATSGMRWINSTIPLGRWGTDRIMVRETWGQHGEQY